MNKGDLFILSTLYIYIYIHLRDPQRIYSKYSILYISLYDTREHIELDLNLQVKLSLWAMTSDHVQNQLRLKRVREKGGR